MNYIKLDEMLRQSGYVPTKDILYAVGAVLEENAPLIIEGAPGVGKTSLAKAVSMITGTKLSRVQFYDGLTADKILYDYDYQRMLLTIEAIKRPLAENLKNMPIKEAIDKTKNIDFYNEDFLIRRPILNAVEGKERHTLLLDEIDKSTEEIEYTLLETLENYEITIPQLGKTVKCSDDMKPFVFITSNGYRELSGAMKRRCAYVYIERKTKEQMLEILLLKAKADQKICEGVAACMEKIQGMNLKQEPSISEAIDWAGFIQKGIEAGGIEIDNTLCRLTKNEHDKKQVLKSGILKQMGL